jgi:hypothetical protein
MILTLPLINQFSALTQSGVFASLLIISYLNKRARYLVLGLILTYIGVKFIIPVSRWTFTIFKWIAMLGFYGTYFQIGIGFIATGLGGVILFIEKLSTEREQDRTARH